MRKVEGRGELSTPNTSKNLKKGFQKSKILKNLKKRISKLRILKNLKRGFQKCLVIN
jgi:hypothetical protein